MNLQQFEYIVAVDDLKSFSKAAERCYISQSTLSTMIGKFEDEISIKVFNRNTKPVSLTIEGEEVLKRIRKINQKLDSFKQFTKELKKDFSGELNLAVSPTIGPYLLPQFINKFERKREEVTTSVSELNLDRILKLVKNRTIDAAIVPLPVFDSELVEMPLYNEFLLLYDSENITNKKNLKSKNARINHSMIDYERLYLLEDEILYQNELASVYNQYKQKDTIARKMYYESGSIDTLVRLVKKKKGVTLIPYLAFLDLPKKEQKKVTRFEEPFPLRTIGLITHKNFAKKRLVKDLKKTIQKAVFPLFKDRNTLVEDGYNKELFEKNKYFEADETF